MDRTLVRSYSGRLLWLTGLQVSDPKTGPKSEALAARILSVASIIALTSLIALVVEMTTAYYYGEALCCCLTCSSPSLLPSLARCPPHDAPTLSGATLFGSLLLPLLGWAGIRCRSRCLLICFTLACGVMLAVFLATTLPFLVQVAPSLASWDSWLYVFAFMSIMMAILHVLGLVLGCQAAANPLFLAPMRKEVLTAVTPAEAAYLYGVGPPEAKTVYLAPQHAAPLEASSGMQQASAGKQKPPVLSSVV